MTESGTGNIHGRGHDAYDTDVAVLGAGLSGLVAARDIEAAGLRARVFEARDRVGGRVANEQLPGGAPVEIGGEFVGADQRDLLQLASELGVDTFPAYDEGHRLFEHAGRVRRYKRRIPPLGPLALADLGQAVWRLERMSRTLPDETPWQAAKAREWDREPLGAWIRRHTHTRGARAAIETGAETIWPVGPDEVSLLHALFFLRFAGGLEPLAETSGGAQDARFVGGSHELAVRLAASLEGSVELNHPVTDIRWAEAHVSIIADNREHTARCAVIAMSPALWGQIRFDPPLPVERDQIAQRMPTGAAIKCQAVYDEPFWRDAGLNGQAISTSGPISVTIDNSPESGSPGVMCGFICGRAARQASQLSPTERRGLVLDAYVRLFGPRAGHPTDYLEQNWTAEPYSRGCYAAAMGPNGWTELGPMLRAPLGPLHWAGAETASRWYGYMDGAVSAGHRAARDVTTALDRQAHALQSDPA